MIDHLGSTHPYAAQTTPANKTSKSAQPVENTDNVAKRNDNSALVEEIREKGFKGYVKELEAKKLEELREKILRAMGLSEEDLAAMPGKERAVIEEVIAQEIRERMTGQAENGDKQGPVVINVVV